MCEVLPDEPKEDIEIGNIEKHSLLHKDMNIIYGVSGVGLGHSSRAKEIIQHLQKNNHKVLVLTYGQAYPVLKEVAPVIKISGIPLFFQEGRLHLSKTIILGLKSVLTNSTNILSIRNKLKKFSPDICITDTEPYSTLISYIFNIPLISIDNHHMITHLDIQKKPKQKKDYFILRAATFLSAIGANQYVILSFVKPKKSKNNSYIVNPLLRKEVLKIKPTLSDFILVYHSIADENLLNILRKIPQKFIIYGYNKEGKEKNLTFKKSGEGFTNDLASCKAIIATTGFSLISEALYLKKPYFGIPVKNHYEQTINAIYLKKSGFGTYYEKPSLENINNFLSNLKKYKLKNKSFKINPKEALMTIDKIINNIKR